MNIKTLAAAFGIALTTFAIGANAQKKITTGVATYDTQVRGQPAVAKIFFTPDSSAATVSFGAGSFKLVADAKYTYVAFALDIPVAGMKKMAVASPSDIEQFQAQRPHFTFTPTTETKTISGFNCKKVSAKDDKSGKSYDVWITNDITVPATAMESYYKEIGGFPVQYTAFQMGQEVSVTIKSITEGNVPAGTFVIPKDFEKVNLEDLFGGGQ